MLTRRHLLQASSLVLLPGPAKAGPLEGLETPQILDVTFEQVNDLDVKLDFYWVLKDQDFPYILTSLSFQTDHSSDLKKAWPAHRPLPKLFRTQEEMLRVAKERVTLEAEDFRLYRRHTGFSVSEARRHGLEPIVRTWRKTREGWQPFFSFSRRPAGYHGRPVEVAEWIDVARQNHTGWDPIRDPKLAREVAVRFDHYTRRPVWDELTIEEEDRYLRGLLP